jgi:hypothetical protein
MKKMLFAFVIVLSIFLAGCSVDMQNSMAGKASGYYYTGIYDMNYDGETLTLNTEKDVFALYRAISVNGEFIDNKVGNDFQRQTSDFTVFSGTKSVSGLLDIEKLSYGNNDIRLVAYKLKAMNGKPGWDTDNYYVFKTSYYKESPFECENGQEVCLSEISAKSCVNGFWENKSCFYCTEDTCLASPDDNMTEMCMDSDGGIDYYTYGEIYNEGKLIGIDNCKSGPNGYLSVESGTHLWENYWDENCVQQHEIVECPYGCYNGACQQEPVWEASLNDYPAMYIEADGSFNGIVIVGARSNSMDVVAANKVIADLQSHAVRKTWIETGESKIDLELRDVELGTMIGQMRPTVTKSDFTNLLQDSWIETDDGYEIDYTQEIGLGNAVVGYGLGEGDVLSEPVLHLQADEVNSAYDRYFYSYKVRFEEPIDLTSPEVRGSEIKLFGDRYIIGPESTDSNGLQILKGEGMTLVPDTGYEMELGGLTDVITLLDISSSSEAALKVNSMVKEISEGSRYSIDGVEVYVDEISLFNNGEGYVKLLVITKELYIKNGEPAYRADMMEEIEGSYVDASTSASAFSGFTVYVGPKDWDAPLLMEEEQYMDSVFKAVGLDFDSGSIYEDNPNIVDLNVYLVDVNSVNGYWETEFVPIPSSAMILDSEVDFRLDTMNIISVGSPCVNDVSASIVGNKADCSWPIGPSEGIIWIRNAGVGKNHLVLYGYDDRMINVAAQILSDIDQIEMPVDTKILKVTSYDGVSVDVRAMKESDLYERVVECTPNTLVGDADGNGYINSDDVDLVTDIVAGTVTPPSDRCCVDIDRSGRVDVIDISLLKNFINGQPSDHIGKKCSSELCTDTDGGKNYIEAGKTVGGTGGSPAYTAYDKCIDPNNLLEFYCNEDGYVMRENLLCLDGCSGGACNTERTCVDSDDRYDTEYKQYFRAGNTTALGVTKEDACTISTCEIGTNCGETEYFVREWTCNKESPTGMLEVVAECEYGCEAGACVEYDSCSDDEVGANPDIKGHVSIESTNTVERFYEDDEDNLFFDVKKIDVDSGIGEAEIFFYGNGETLNVMEGKSYESQFLNFEVLDIYVDPTDSTKDYVEIKITGISDVCDMEDNLVDFTCENNDIDSMEFDCPYGCWDGICLDSRPQSIWLNQGWNIVSFNVGPDGFNLPVGEFFTLVGGAQEGDIIEDNDGSSSYSAGVWSNPNFIVSSLDAYKIRVNTGREITVYQHSEFDYKTPIELQAGWNLLPYYLRNPVDLPVALSSIQDKIIKVQDEAGNAYEDWGTYGGWQNNIGMMMPGEGYKIEVSEPVTLIYDDGSYVPTPIYWQTSDIAIVSAQMTTDSSAGNQMLKLRNNLRSTITIKSVKLSTSGSGSVERFNVEDIVLSPGQSKTVENDVIFDICNQAGDSYVSNVEITYVDAETGATYIFTGEGNKFDGTCTNAVLDTTPRIAYWYGKVNQHTENGVWTTDPDGTSGANLDMLTYCQKWYDGVVGVEPYKIETMTFYTSESTGSVPYESTKQTYECVQGV